MRWAPKREPILLQRGGNRPQAPSLYDYYQYILMKTAPTIIEVMPMTFL